RDLEKAVQEGNFRPDLYYRLNVFKITVPPLRDRREDIPALIWWFVNKFAKKMGKKIETIPRQAMATYQHYRWPGNVRELMNLTERSVILTEGPVLNASMPVDSRFESSEEMSLVEVERKHILRILQLTNWRIRGKNGAAELLGLIPTTLESRMKKLGLVRPK
ncbi:MAG: sigma-54-dependent Fis family transcriptional regulator, partial [Desulfomonilaceae bacterium]